MQRLLILFLSLAAFTSPTHAQPAPGNSPADQPPNPPADQPPAAPPEAAPPGATLPPPSVAPAPGASATKPAEDMPRKLSVGKDSPGAFFSPGLLMQGWFVWDESTKKATSGDVDFSTTNLRIRRLE